MTATHARPSLFDTLRSGLRDLRNAASEMPDVAADVRDLLKGDVQLGVAEMRESGKQAGMAGGIAATAGVLAVIGTVFACLALMFALATTLELWLAALIVSLIVFGVASIAGLVARSRLKSVQPVPRRALQSLEKDLTWLRAQLNSSKN
jgi:hypothetical protein